MKNVLYVIFLLSASMCFAEEYIVLRSGGFSVAHHSGKVITRDVKAGQIVEKIPGLNGEKHKKIKYSIHVDGYSGLINFEGIVSSENVLAFDDFTYKKCFGEYQKIVKFKSSVSAFKMADHDNSYWVILLPDGSFKFNNEVGQLYLFAELIIGVLNHDSVFFGRLEKGGLDLFSLYGAGYEPSFIEKVNFKLDE